MPSVAGAVGGGAGAAGDLFSGIFGGLADFAQAKGYKAEQAAYLAAEGFANQNAAISAEAGDIKQEQAGRAIYKTLGAQAAGYAGAGLTTGGSAQSVLRDSLSQGALEKAIINEQTQINVTGYKEQATQFGGMAAAASAAASAAKKSGTGSIISGVFSAIGDVAAIFSDRRLKTDIARVASHGELGIYRFRFIGEDEPRLGVMADEVAVHAPYALGPVVNGYATVDYAKLGLGHLVGQEG